MKMQACFSLCELIVSLSPRPVVTSRAKDQQACLGHPAVPKKSVLVSSIFVQGPHSE